MIISAIQTDDQAGRPSPCGAHRLAQMPIIITNAPELLVFSTQEHAGSIMKITPSDKGVFGITSPTRQALL